MNIAASLLSIAWSLSVIMTVVLLGHEHAAATAWMW